jgi:hypothetical protein
MGGDQLRARMATAMAMAMATGDDPVRQLIEMGEGACLIGEGIKVAGGRGRPVGLIGVGAAPLVGVAKPRTAPLTSGAGRGGAERSGAAQGRERGCAFLSRASCTYIVPRTPALSIQYPLPIPQLSREGLGAPPAARSSETNDSRTTLYLRTSLLCTL